MEQGNIKPIDRTSVHKICSGQVVLTLATAVKELVENSIDAGATVIEVKAKEYGSELIEVSDNGKGVKACDFQNLTLKHHTSKIADFSDVPFVSTFGFRGEALSSLCALSDLEITTCHQDADVGTTLIFDHNGVLVKNTPTPRQVGTTVILKNIFSTFPVRHKEFLRHIRKEFSKMVQLLTAYCLISVNRRITCTNTTEKGKKNIVLSTNSSANYKDNILTIFGDKQLKQLMEIKQHEPSKEILDEYFLPETSTETSKVFTLEGYISNSTHGEGRSSSDRQFYFINGRPCDLPKISKLVNEVYHSFNRHQYPFVFMNIILNQGQADINVTPDKRQIFIPDEKVLLALIKTTLLEMYEPQPAQMPITPFTISQEKTESSLSTSTISNSTENEAPSDSTTKRKFQICDSLSDDEDEKPVPSSFKKWKMNDSQEESMDTEHSNSPTDNNPTLKASTVTEKAPATHSSSLNSFPQSDKTPAKTEDSNKTYSENVMSSSTRQISEDKLIKKISPKQLGKSSLQEILDSARRTANSSSQAPSSSSQPSRSSSQPPTSSRRKPIRIDLENRRREAEYEKIVASDKVFIFLDKFSNNRRQHPESFPNQEVLVENVAEHYHSECSINGIPKVLMKTVVEELSSRQKTYTSIAFSMDMFKRTKGLETEVSNEQNSYRKFRTRLLPTNNESAIEELKKEISKDSFSQMEIIGVFNVGFIIVKLHDDLFLIDQHASDEKYNFEKLQKQTVFETQLLLQPQMLNLTAVAEATLLDHLQVFEMNGFKFSINEDNPTGEKVKLVSVPVSKDWSMGKEDIDELIFMLTDNPVRMVRPSRVNQMFAMRACRDAVKFGNPLTRPMIKNLILHMGEMDQPWNCPHGRPTMRHLLNLKILRNC